jgi:hypothetical protein
MQAYIFILYERKRMIYETVDETAKLLILLEFLAVRNDTKCFWICWVYGRPTFRLLRFRGFPFKIKHLGVSFLLRVVVRVIRVRITGRARRTGLSMHKASRRCQIAFADSPAALHESSPHPSCS